MPSLDWVDEYILLLCFRSFCCCLLKYMLVCKGGGFVSVIPKQCVRVGVLENIAAWSLPVILEDNLSNP